MAKAETQRYVICGECAKAYPMTVIDVFLGDQKQMTLDRLEAGRTPSNKDDNKAVSMAKVLLGGRKQSRSSPRVINVERLQRFIFKCPQGHLVDGNRGTQFPIAVLGGSGASKSHFLPAIIRDLDELRTLSKVGVTLGPSLYTNSKISDDADEIYRQHRLLDPTPTDIGVLGPYGYRLKIASRQRDPKPDELSLLLFDVAGENLADIMRVAESARFLLLSEAIVVLIDPDRFLPSSFDDQAHVSPQKRTNAAIDVRKGIRVIIDTIAEAWSTPASSLTVPFCFVVAKADAVEWKSGFNWDEQTKIVMGCAGNGMSLSNALFQASENARAALLELGGDLVVDEIESVLETQWVRFAVASATSTMPIAHAERDGGSAWMTEPEPNGVGLAILQALDMAGILPESYTHIGG